MVRLGVLGAGNIADLNVRGYLEDQRCDVVAVCDSRRDNAEAAARRWGAARWYTDLDEFLADDAVDAVEVLTPTHLHHAHVLACLAAGKHVSCQKPLANSVADAREMAAAAVAAGRVLRVSECNLHYPPLVRAKRLIADGAIGRPTFIRLKTLVADTDTEFQNGLDPAGYGWRFGTDSPGGHLFDDVVHKYATALWMFDAPITSVQAVVRPGRLFFETPTAAIFEYDRPDLLGTLDVQHAPRLKIASSFFGADEIFEVTGTDGVLWVTRCTGEMLDAPPIVLQTSAGTQAIDDLDANWAQGFVGSSREFIDGLVEGRQPDMTPDLAIAVLQVCFAVYQASDERRPVDPRSIEGSFTPKHWPPSADKMRADVEWIMAGMPLD